MPPQSSAVSRSTTRRPRIVGPIRNRPSCTRLPSTKPRKKYSRRSACSSVSRRAAKSRAYCCTRGCASKYIVRCVRPWLSSDTRSSRLCGWSMALRSSVAVRAVLPQRGPGRAAAGGGPLRPQQSPPQDGLQRVRAIRVGQLCERDQGRGDPGLAAAFLRQVHDRGREDLRRLLLQPVRLRGLVAGAQRLLDQDPCVVVVAFQREQSLPTGPVQRTLAQLMEQVPAERVALG